MPGYKEHMIIGMIFVFGFLLFNYAFGWFNIAYTLENMAVLMVVSLFYSLLPDYDISSSKISAVITLICVFGIIFSFMFGETLLGIFLAVVLLVPHIFKHRGFLHSIMAGVLLSLPMWLIAGMGVFLCCFIAYFSHLLADGEIKLI